MRVIHQHNNGSRFIVHLLLTRYGWWEYSRVEDNFKMSSLGNKVTLTISLIELDVKSFLALEMGGRNHPFFFFYLSITDLQLYVSFRCKNIVVWYFYTLWNDHVDKSSYHLSPYKVTTVFAVLYITSPGLNYFITEVCTLHSLHLFTHPPHFSNNHSFGLCVCHAFL